MTAEPLVLGLDLGTSYLKAALHDRHGRRHGFARVALPWSFTEGRRAELTAGAFIGAFEQLLGECLAPVHRGSHPLAGISWSSQANTFLLLDGEGGPLTPVILWIDERAGAEAAPMEAIWNRDDYTRRTGLAFSSPQMAAAKMLWIQRHEPCAWEHMRRVVDLPSWVSFLLTGNAAGDLASSALTGLWDFEEGRWWEPPLEVLDLEPARLYAPLPTGALAGTVDARAAERFALPAGVPLFAGTLDHFAAAHGSGVGTHHPASESTGTTLAVTASASERRPGAGMIVAPGPMPGTWMGLDFSDKGARQVEEYLARCQCPFDLPTAVDQAIHHLRVKTVPRQHTNPAPSSDPAEIIRELANLIACLTDDLAGLMKRCLGAMPTSVVATGGGAANDLWLQYKADQWGIPVIRPTQDEPACFGAALIAAAALQWPPPQADGAPPATFNPTGR